MNTSSASSMYTVFLPLLLFFVVMWFFILRPQRKKDKETRDMRSKLGPGDEVTTIGGIVGTVLNVKEDSVVLYCGSDKVKIEFKKWAIGEVTKKKNDPKKADPKKDAGKDSSKAASVSESTNEEAAPKFRKLERKEEE